RSHRSGLRDAHDSTPAPAEPVSAVASNPPSGPALVAAEVTAGEEGTSSGAEHHLDPELARKYMANIKRFRILVMGRANAGKTTILQRVCNTTDNPEITDGKGNKIESAIVRGTLERGHHKIEHELVFSSNPGFVFHDSCGFEAGSARQFNEMKSFVVHRASAGSLKERIHAIWFCIPMTDYHRTVTAAEQKFFNECDTGHVPVIVLLTKTEALHDLAMEELSDDGLTVGEAKEKAVEKERELLERWLAHIKKMLEKCKFPPKAYVSVQKMHEEGADCTRLVECTTNAMNEEGLQRLLVSTQQSSVALCIEYAVKKTLIPKMELGIKDRFLGNVKDLERELLSWFPSEYSSLAVVDDDAAISSLPQNSTLLGKFPTVQSMVGYAIVCLLVFEHAYFLMQQGSGDWKETLTMAVNKCKSSDIQTAISTAVKVAFQQHGNNGAELYKTILKVIGENKICVT
ncbi:hypothetical protein PISMIDRAFT_681814, partial [Pisolithus microcarpus 441]